ncbi:sulfur carrier protein ThiS adenylyltransferase ThiF [Cellulosilyticum ruminicola]|uniref:sulfur carrier protein ThiS adenylyltransferase ThiF n=1 Tax=Cellulosilyticum ruminicola TaxID=425254 RepID=UPI000AD9D672|nr:sulfur carrier protein ThiS adenylyltransferase ThiF [Cellulosilyticum ruminicola]
MKVSINGKQQEVKSKSLWTLKEEFLYGATRAIKGPLITIYNGFQTDEDLKLDEGDEVAFIVKGEMPSKEELEALMCARHTPSVHEKVKKAKVAIAGLGGLGSHIAIELARTGVGHLHLVDFDIVEPSNLNRQMYKIKHLGMYKTEALKQEIQEINPYITVEIDTFKVTQENVLDLFKEEEIVCEAFDKPEAKAMIVNALLEARGDIKIVAASGMAGYESSNEIQTKKINKRLYICGDLYNGAKQEWGLWRLE